MGLIPVGYTSYFRVLTQFHSFASHSPAAHCWSRPWPSHLLVELLALLVLRLGHVGQRGDGILALGQSLTQCIQFTLHERWGIQAHIGGDLGHNVAQLQDSVILGRQVVLANLCKCRDMEANLVNEVQGIITRFCSSKQVISLNDQLKTISIEVIYQLYSFNIPFAFCLTISNTFCSFSPPKSSFWTKHTPIILDAWQNVTGLYLTRRRPQRRMYLAQAGRAGVPFRAADPYQLCCRVHFPARQW